MNGHEEHAFMQDLVVLQRVEQSNRGMSQVACHEDRRPWDTGGSVGFESFNELTKRQRVADIVAALQANLGAALVGSGDAALAALLASAVTPARLAILEVGQFDTQKDDDFVERFYIPGLRRAGDFATAAAVAGKAVVIHGAGPGFTLPEVKVSNAKMTPKEIVARLKQK